MAADDIPRPYQEKLRDLLDQVANGTVAPKDAFYSLTRGTRTSIASAERAMASGEFAEARRMFERALGDAREAADDNSLADALFGLGRALNTVDGKSGAGFICDAFDAYVSAGNKAGALRAAAEQGGFPYNTRILMMLESALALAPLGSPEHTAVLSRFGIVRGFLSGDTHLADEAFVGAIDAATPRGDHEALTFSWKRRAMLNFQNLRFATAMEQSMIAVSHAMRTESPEVICRAAEDAARFALVVGNTQTAKHYLELYRSAAERLAYPNDIFASVYLSAQLAIGQGRFTAARQLLRVLIARDDLSNTHKSVARSLEALALAETGSEESAQLILDEIALAEASLHARLNIDLLLTLRGHALDLGVLSSELAENLAHRSQEWMSSQTSPAFHRIALFTEYMYSYVTSNSDAASKVLQLEVSSSDGVVTAARLWCTNHYRALGNVAAEKWKTAEEEFDTAIAEYRDAELVQPLVWSVVHYSEMALRSGRRSQLQRSATLIAEAESTAKDLEMFAARERLTSARLRLGQRGRQVMGLTDRERQVLGLLTKGKRYAEIAEDLFLSQNTVASHIKNIYTKLGVKSRAEAALVGSRLLDSDRYFT